MSLYKHSQPKPQVGVTEFEILQSSHKFLRDEKDENSSSTTSWEDQLAAKYYTSLYREFAVCDLKHYKSGNFALRWRTEDEVLSGAGETTCGNARCEHHSYSPSGSSRLLDSDLGSTGSQVPLTTLELPFAYSEHGESKSALVKVVLCRKCLKKLMWKKNKEREKQKSDSVGVVDSGDDGEERQRSKSSYKEDKERDRVENENIRQRKRLREEEDDGNNRREGSPRRRRRSR